jgi:hypothetical protein
MKKSLALLIAIVLASAAGYLAVHALRGRRGPNALSSAPGRSASPAGGGARTSAASSSIPSPAASAGAAMPADAINVAAPEIGGHIELVTSEEDREDRAAIHLIDLSNPADSSWRATAAAPQDIVIGFFEQEAALISAIVINPNAHTSVRWPKDVEAWTSMESPTAGFVKASSLTLVHDDVEQTMTFTPVEARFVKIRIVSQYGDDTVVGMGKIRVIEARRAGYTPLSVRNPKLARLLASVATDSPGGPGEVVAHEAALPSLPAAVESGATAASACSATPPIAPPPARGSSAKVLVLARTDRMYPPLWYTANGYSAQKPATASLARIAFTRVPPGAASAALLEPAVGFDTVVLSQICDIKTSVPDSFKRAVVNWVGQGHKLIIHDADTCDDTNAPDYSFLPYRFSTSNPGKRGAPGEKLMFVEENTLANSKGTDPAFLDLGAWTSNPNQLGDSNTVKTYDPHWCGHIVTRNVLNVNGFVETYAHYGRGLIIYDGFDCDQSMNEQYIRLATRELAQPFDPDGLACGARLSDFVLTTEQALRTQYMSAGQTYRYPVTLVSNQGYKGTIQLTASVVPQDSTVSATLDRDAVDLTDLSDVRLTVTASGAASPSERTIAVRGTDGTGRSNVLCLRLGERSTGTLRVATEFPKPARPAKNLEIILDLSGSMKLPLGKSTRIATARRVLREVIAKIPDDFNVGLRLYGHRYGSRQKETCTDSELVVPIQKLDRTRLLSVIDSTQPRGETPLVYSVLQTAADLKAAGGGSVILITDGEESCHGDVVAAARELKASGVDISLQILGFTLTGKQVQQQLSQFAQATGGRYYSAQDGETLGRALLMAAVDKMPVMVFDATGHQVGSGDTDSASIELAPGEYKVVIRAADQELVGEHVAVAARSESVLKIVIKNDRFELKR